MVRRADHTGIPAGSVEALEYMRASIARDLRAARKVAGLSRSELAKKLSKSQYPNLGISFSSVVAGTESGRVAAGARYVAAVLRACKLPKDWRARGAPAYIVMPPWLASLRDDEELAHDAWRALIERARAIRHGGDEDAFRKADATMREIERGTLKGAAARRGVERALSAYMKEHGRVRPWPPPCARCGYAGEARGESERELRPPAGPAARRLKRWARSGALLTADAEFRAAGARVRERTDLVALVGETIPLRPNPHNKGRTFVGRCPSHKATGLHVDPESKPPHFVCFECEGVSGDAVDWVMLRDGVDFERAVRILAKRVGLWVPTRPRLPRARGRTRTREATK